MYCCWTQGCTCARCICTRLSLSPSHPSSHHSSHHSSPPFSLPCSFSQVRNDFEWQDVQRVYGAAVGDLTPLFWSTKRWSGGVAETGGTTGGELDIEGVRHAKPESLTAADAPALVSLALGMVEEQERQLSNSGNSVGGRSVSRRDVSSAPGYPPNNKAELVLGLAKPSHEVDMDGVGNGESQRLRGHLAPWTAAMLHTGDTGGTGGRGAAALPAATGGVGEGPKVRGLTKSLQVERGTKLEIRSSTKAARRSSQVASLSLKRNGFSSNSLSASLLRRSAPISYALWWRRWQCGRRRRRR